MASAVAIVNVAIDRPVLRRDVDGPAIEEARPPRSSIAEDQVNDLGHRTAGPAGREVAGDGLQASLRRRAMRLPEQGDPLVDLLDQFRHLPALERGCPRSGRRGSAIPPRISATFASNAWQVGLVAREQEGPLRRLGLADRQDDPVAAGTVTSRVWTTQRFFSTRPQIFQ